MITDYQDRFERGGTTDEHSSLEWGRAAFAGTGGPLLQAAVRIVHRHVLRFRLAQASAADQLVGWTITDETPDKLVLEADGGLMAGRLELIRTPRKETVALSTTLQFHRPGPAKLVWLAVGPLHRALAPVLITRAAKNLGASGGKVERKA